MNNDLKKYLSLNKTKSFQQLLFEYIDNNVYKDSDVYNKVQLDRKLFSKIRCNKNYIPRKNNIIKLCLALTLDKNNTNKLLNSAGYSLSNNNTTDLVISYCIDNQIYDLDIVNDYLYTLTDTIPITF